ncbi:hypothetical protein HanPSC8_Chr04g0175121 [Helianthus annuus]|nr:hypothetical protein HanPSC8_Chr04g0175121 [Helianthus annuus]
MSCVGAPNGDTMQKSGITKQTQFTIVSNPILNKRMCGRTQVKLLTSSSTETTRLPSCSK